MLKKESIEKSNKKAKLPFAVFVSTEEYTKSQCDEEVITEYMQIFTSIIEERIQNKSRNKK